MINKEGLEGLSSRRMCWRCWQCQVYLLDYLLLARGTSLLGFFFVRRVLNNHFPVATPGLGFGLGAGSFPLAIAKGFPPVSFLAVCLVRAIQ